MIAYDRMIKLRNEGLSAIEVAKKLNEEGLRNKRGGLFKRGAVYSAFQALKQNKKKNKQKKMIELPVLEDRKLTSNKIAILFANAEEAHSILERWTSHG